MVVGRHRAKPTTSFALSMDLINWLVLDKYHAIHRISPGWHRTSTCNSTIGYMRPLYLWRATTVTSMEPTYTSRWYSRCPKLTSVSFHFYRIARAKQYNVYYKGNRNWNRNHYSEYTLCSCTTGCLCAWTTSFSNFRIISEPSCSCLQQPSCM